MKKLITAEVIKATNDKGPRMQLGTYSRLKINNEISDLVINPTLSGVWFHKFNDEPNTIGQNISAKVICFISYNDLK